MLMAITLFAMSALLAWSVARIVLANASRLGLVQEPIHRSSHVRPTAVGGGLGIVVSGMLVSFWPSITPSTDLICALVLGGGLAVLGLIDDIRSVPARFRFFVHVILVAAMVWQLSPLPVLALPLGLKLNGLPLALAVVSIGVWWVNLFNFMDGIDGIAGSQAIFMFSASAFLLWRWDPVTFPSPTGLRILALAGATVGFLFLNWPPARIFMGDVGSTYLAFMLFVLALMTIRIGALSYATWVLLGMVFISDATTTLIQRVFRGERWTEPHRSHAYQRLAQRWGSHLKVLLLYGAFNFFCLTPLAMWLSCRGDFEWVVVWLVYLGCSVVVIAIPKQELPLAPT